MPTRWLGVCFVALLAACAHNEPPPPSYQVAAPAPSAPIPLAPEATIPPEAPPPAYHRHHHCSAGSHWVASHWAHGVHVAGRCRTNAA